MALDPKIIGVEKAYEAIASRKASIDKLAAEIKALDSYTENGEPSDTLPVQWPSGSLNGPQKHVRVAVAVWKAFLEDLLNTDIAAVNAVDVDAIIAAEKAKG